MPHEPQDATDPACPDRRRCDYVDPHHEGPCVPTPAVVLENYSRMLRAMARRVGRDRRLRIAVMREYTEIRAALARLASAVGLPGAGVDEIEAAIGELIKSRGRWRGAAEQLATQVGAMREELGVPEGYDEEDVVLEIRRLRAELAEARDSGTDDRALVENWTSCGFNEDGQHRWGTGRAKNECDECDAPRWVHAPVLRSPVPPAPDEAREELIDRCARAALETEPDAPSWMDLSDNVREAYRVQVRAVLAEAASETTERRNDC